MEDGDLQLVNKFQVLSVADTVEAENKITNSSYQTFLPDSEKLYDEYSNISTLKKMKEFCAKNHILAPRNLTFSALKYHKMKEFCAKNHIIPPKNLTFSALKYHVYKLYASQFTAIQKGRQMKRAEIKDEKYQPPFDYYIVIDLECTCWADNTKKMQEIIEFPAVLIDAKNKVIVDTFQEYVKPRIHPELSEFCIDFTGISQETVDNAESLHKVIVLFRKWLIKNELKDPRKYLIVTDGREDIRHFLNLGLLINNLPFPHELRCFADIKVLFRKWHNGSSKFLDMMDFYGLKFEGRHHCGLDDAKNIARLVMKMCSRRNKIVPTNKMV
uniref:Exonuclease domain-containing protein n=1 Tax=Panagrolaimus sp. PS1159 TaxID=55785 RepID=A0AC35F1C4_9BILA